MPPHPAPAPVRTTRPPRRLARRWLGRLALVIGGPLAFFALLEGGLRLAGFGRSADFFIPDDQPGIFRTNPRYTELFFPASFGLKPLNFRLAKIKPAGTVRIFVLGESAAMGVPEPGFAIAPQLRAQLRAAYPGKEIEVCNLGITAINSHVIRHIVGQIVRFQPDLLVIYMGNNEVIGPYGPGSAVTETTLPPVLVSAGIWLRGTRTGQLLERVVRAAGRAGRDFREWRGMEMFASRTVPADDPRLQAVYRSFSANLAAILRCARGRGIKVVLSTVAVNLRDCAPLASRHRPALPAADLGRWQESVDQAGLAAGLGDTARAQALLERALAIDPAYAEIHYRLARILDGRGDAGAARRQYFEALQRDALRFRCDARLNEIIRDQARAAVGTVTLVDAARAMGADEAATVAPAGHELFFEHVHITWEGNCRLARLLAEAAGPVLFGGGSAPGRWLAPAECAAAVGYTAFGRATMLRRMAGMTARPPFSGQFGFAADRAWLEGETAAAEAELAAPDARRSVIGAIARARRNDPGNPFLILHAANADLQFGDAAGALELNGQLSALEPASPENAAQRAFALQQLGRVSEAEEVLLQSAAADPYYYQTYSLLGGLWAASGRIPRALDYFSELTVRMPESAGVRLTYAQLLASAGDWPAAEQQWRAVLRLVPDLESALEPLVRGLFARHRSGDAEELMLSAYAYNPHDLANNARLEAVAEAKGDLEKTVTYMRAMTESGPVRAVLHADLAVNLGRLGRREEMRVELRRAREAATAEGDGELLRRVEGLIRQQEEGPP